MNDRPKAIYTGTLFNGLVDCYVLGDKRRVISQRGAVRALTSDGESDGAKTGDLGRYLDRLPSRFAHLALAPRFELSLPSGGTASGITAEQFYDLLVAYSEAAEAGELHAKQLPLAANANRLVRAIGRVGIVALVDEATGYQVEREADELQGLVARYLLEEPAKWRRLWDDEVVGRLCALYRVERVGNLFPAFACSIISKLYQLILPPEIYAEMKVRNGRGDDRVANHHQLFREGLWRFVHNDIPFIAYIARISRGTDEFWNHMHARYGGAPFQPSLL